ncbi:hypothetical protein SYNPS1DRAFT_27698 [Syncephalis pseudoplumigaleata]|uniref:Uncharacterized protein n=1 Tax=Syncephalis pseudoplumigaleata TaxID=1712513 RepID=A0A4P9Z2J9_9FUNG|nr:hypothetical protein SYNPS1DRAFT_27698 [Syncephalis pseudoplumigaleata]|eukprot:RKP26626.1 hypothetical protein SYNPS1DRAFT_27698 [Syncephalis pseudoplumigaleata]
MPAFSASTAYFYFFTPTAHSLPSLFQLQNENLREQLAKLTSDSGRDQKNLDEVQAERERLEAQLYACQQDNDALQQEVQAAARRQREAEKAQQKEVKMIEKERAAWAEKEAAHQEQLQTLQRQLHRALETRQEEQARKLGDQYVRAHAPVLMSLYFRRLSRLDTRQVIHEHAAASPQAHAQQRELVAARKTIRDQEKLITELRDRIEQDQGSAAELSEQYNSQAMRTAILRAENKELKELNQALQEDNESYQILLQERTMNGDFMLRSASESSQHDRPSATGLGIDLAAELTRAMSPPGSPRRGSAPGLLDSLEHSLINENGKLKGEVKALKDEIKALTLYINKILSRIMEKEQLVNVLARDYEEPTIPEEPAKPPAPRRRLSLLVTPSMLSPRNKASTTPRLHRAAKTTSLISGFS